MKKNLRIIYMGTPEFAVPSLEALVEAGYEVVAVITAPDKPAGRGMKLQPSAVKEAAVRLHLPVLQPSNLKSPDFLAELKAFNANLQIVVAFRMLPESVWNMPEYGTFNLHASLLPNYRGAAPINWAVINGETETGLTTFFLTHEIDTGDIIFQEKEPISINDTAGEVYDRLMQKGAKLIIHTVESIAKGEYAPKPQSMAGQYKSAPKINKENCAIDFSKTSEEVRNLVRGMAPYPAAWTELQGKKLKVYHVEATHDGWPYKEEVYATDGKTFLAFQTANGYVKLTDIQMEGKKRMGIAEFLRGFQP